MDALCSLFTSVPWASLQKSRGFFTFSCNLVLRNESFSFLFLPRDSSVTSFNYSTLTELHLYTSLLLFLLFYLSHHGFTCCLTVYHMFGTSCRSTRWTNICDFFFCSSCCSRADSMGSDLRYVNAEMLGASDRWDAAVSLVSQGESSGHCVLCEAARARGSKEGQLPLPFF